MQNFPQYLNYRRQESQCRVGYNDITINQENGRLVEKFHSLLLLEIYDLFFISSIVIRIMYTKF